MLIDKVPVKWGKPEYVLFSVEGTTLYVGKGENTVSVDLQQTQQDTSQTIYIMQDYSGTLGIGLDAGVMPVLIAEIPPYKTQLVATGEQNEKGEDTYKPERIPVDVDNIQFTLYPMEYPLEAAETATTAGTSAKTDSEAADEKGEN